MKIQSTNESISQEADAEVTPVIVVHPSPSQVANESERLGSKWGDEVESKVNEVDLRRVSNEPIEGMQISNADKRYTGRALNRSIQNTGIIGTVVYELYDPTKPHPLNPQAYPADNSYAPPPQ
ncbi:hypothetical protein [Psychrobacter sp.]|uniref:hypothetical protein n=1 Tax=Psychrobacter sp. TaxID=56811 RepID=UPI0025EC6347|nr:hypothetical protein [Psychrobacter sp.]